MQVAIVEMKQLKATVQAQTEDFKTSISALQSQFSNVQSIRDIERRLSLLEVRPVEPAHSMVTFAEDIAQISMTTLIERAQVLESILTRLEPSLSTLHSSISSGPLEPPEGFKKEEGQPKQTETQPCPRTNLYISGWSGLRDGFGFALILEEHH